MGYAMRDTTQRLLDDLRWRLSPNGRRFRPDRQTIKSWGASEIPGAVPILLWLAWLIGSNFMMANLHSGGTLLEIIIPLSWIGSGFLISRWARHTNLQNIRRAYHRLLDSNERFLLIEYTRYIRRKIKLAEGDPVLGGPEEVRRLKQIHRKLRQVLEKGRQGAGGAPVRSILSDEADHAESLIEVYDNPDDPLAELDARLPADIRSRLDEFEDSNQQVERQRRMEHEN
jgi:hypothetical protein